MTYLEYLYVNRVDIDHHGNQRVRNLRLSVQYCTGLLWSSSL